MEPTRRDPKTPTMCIAARVATNYLSQQCKPMKYLALRRKIHSVYNVYSPNNVLLIITISFDIPNGTTYIEKK